MGLTQKEAAARLKVSMRAWHSWERGVRVPSPAMQAVIFGIFAKGESL